MSHEQAELMPNSLFGSASNLLLSEKLNVEQEVGKMLKAENHKSK
jgi:hypothetical protein